MQTDNIGAKAAGVVFPPVIVFHDGADYWLADGFQRLIAAEELGLTEFSADVREGTRRDAILYAVGANAARPEAHEQVQAQRRDDAAERSGVVSQGIRLDKQRNARWRSLCPEADCGNASISESFRDRGHARQIHLHHADRQHRREAGGPGGRPGTVSPCPRRMAADRHRRLHPDMAGRAGSRLQPTSSTTVATSRVRAVGSRP